MSKEKEQKPKEYFKEMGKIALKAAICGAILAVGEFAIRLVVSEISGSDKIEFWVRGKRIPVPANREHVKYLDWFYPVKFLIGENEEERRDDFH